MTNDQRPSSLLLDAENPWPGLDSFNETGQDFFYGREEEVNTLLRLVRDSRLVMLFGRSGRGKTSLLQAGLFPRLREEHYIPIYIRLNFQNQSRPFIQQIHDAFLDQLVMREIKYPPFREGEPLWEYLHRRDLKLWSPWDFTLTPVFVLDQFEEIFTSEAYKSDVGKQFRTDLADLIENVIPKTLAKQWQNPESTPADIDFQSQRYTFVLSFREDFLPKLQNWQEAIPSLMHSHFRLRRMNGPQAFEAVFQSGGKTLVDEDMARRIVRFVAAPRGDEDKTSDAVPTEDAVITAETPDAAIENTPLEDLVIEPALLSLICFKLNEKRKQQHKEHIDRELLMNAGHDILHEFYEECINGMPEPTRRFIEDELITESGFRNSYPKQDAINRKVITDAHLESLVNARLLRVEPHMGHDCIELIHDLLAGVIRESRDERHMDEEAQRHRQAEEEHKKQVRDLHRMARRRLYISLGMAFLGMLCILFAIDNYHQKNKAVEAQKLAAASQARAESLVGFMLGDLKEKLEPMGKLGLLASVVEQCMRYYTSLQPAQLTVESISNRAIAMHTLSQIELARGNLAKALEYAKQALISRQELVRKDNNSFRLRTALSESYIDLGDIEQRRGNLSEAEKWYKCALDIRSMLAREQTQHAAVQNDYAISLRKMGEVAKNAGKLTLARQYNLQAMGIMLRLIKSEPNNIKWQDKLIEVYANLGDIAYSSGALDEASEYYQRWHAISKNLKDREPTNTDFRQDLSSCLDRLGIIEQRRGNLAGALDYYERSFRIIKHLSERDPGNTDWQRDLAILGCRRGTIEQSRGNTNVATEHFLQACQILERLTEKDPDNTDWQRELAVTYSKLGDTEQARGNRDKAMEHFQQDHQIFKRLADKDPDNADWQRELAVTYSKLGGIEQARGNQDKAIDYYRQNYQIFKSLTAKDSGNTDWQRDLAVSYSRLGNMEHSRGNLNQAMEYFQQYYQISKRLAEKDPTNADWQNDFAIACDWLAYLSKKRDDPTQAQTYSAQAAQIRKRLK